MTVGTSPEFVCPQGHRLRLDDHPADRADDERLPCLICGGDALPADRPIGEGGEEGLSGRPPRHSSNPPPGRPTFPAIPGYAILSVLGRGRAGVVYEARELARGRHVTLEAASRGQTEFQVNSGFAGSDRRLRGVRPSFKLIGPLCGPPWGQGRLGIRPSFKLT